MRLLDLMKVLVEYQIACEGTDDPNPRIRIGDQLEAGPYEHYPVGGMWKGTAGAIILVGHPDAVGFNEPTKDPLDVLWKPQD